MNEKLKSVDIIMLLLYSPGYTENYNEPISGRKKITKILFLFEKELAKKFKLDKITGEEDIFNFKAWNYGPMSSTIFKDIDFLKNIGFIKTTDNISSNLTIEEVQEYNYYSEKYNDDTDAEFQTETYQLSDKGLNFIKDKQKYDKLSNNQKLCLKEFKKQFNKAPLRDILKYVYTTYPDYTEKSLIKDKVLGGD